MRIAHWTYGMICFSMCLLVTFAGFGNRHAWSAPKSPSTGLSGRLSPMLGTQDAVIVADPDGRTVASVNADRLLVPASTLKILTGLAALHYLGEGYRFPTDFFLTPQKNLVIKGYGDPLLVSERLDEMARHLAELIDQIDHLVLDDSYFSHPIVIPGRNKSTQPYDAPNGALCVNFNTVFFERRNGQWASAEPQTPLLPFAIRKIKASGQKSGRITLAADRKEILQYSGELFDFFLGKAGISIKGEISIDATEREADTLLWRYASPYQLPEVVAALLEFSNNFIANQLMLAMGAGAYGPPADVEKGMRALQSYYASVLGIKTGHLVEASGISRENRISAQVMLQILQHFQPYHQLMRQEGRQWYKTGTLKGVNTRAGYLSCSNGGLYRFVVMINTPGKRTDRIMRIIEQTLK